MDEGHDADEEGAQNADDDRNGIGTGTGSPSPYRRRWLGYGLLALAFFLVSLHRTSTAVLSEGLLYAFEMTATSGYSTPPSSTSTPRCRSLRGC